LQHLVCYRRVQVMSACGTKHACPNISHSATLHSAAEDYLICTLRALKLHLLRNVSSDVASFMVTDAWFEQGINLHCRFYLLLTLLQEIMSGDGDYASNRNALLPVVAGAAGTSMCCACNHVSKDVAKGQMLCSVFAL